MTATFAPDTPRNVSNLALIEHNDCSIMTPRWSIAEYTTAASVLTEQQTRMLTLTGTSQSGITQIPLIPLIPSPVEKRHSKVTAIYSASKTGQLPHQRLRH